MKVINVALGLGATVLLASCAFQAQLMSRSTGKVYQGAMHSGGGGQGTLSVVIDARTCSGPIVRTGSSNNFGLVQSYGKTASAGSFQTFGGTVAAKALLSCSDGSGMRCDVEGSPSGGGGVCEDNNSQVYDLILTPA